MAIYNTDVGIGIKNIREELGISPKEMNSVLAKLFDLSPVTCGEWRRVVERGVIYGYTSYKASTEDAPMYLERLSFFLSFLNLYAIKSDSDSEIPKRISSIAHEIHGIDDRFDNSPYITEYNDSGEKTIGETIKKRRESMNIRTKDVSFMLPTDSG
jgi:hypothetical protein